jgi:hypothetical protein
MFSFGGSRFGTAQHSVHDGYLILAHRPTINELVQHESRWDAIMG